MFLNMATNIAIHHELRSRSCCATGGLKSAPKSGASMSASCPLSEQGFVNSGLLSVNATSESACSAFGHWYSVMCLANEHPEGWGVIRAQARYIDPRAAGGFG